jgi:hypothetical protein
MMDFKLMVDVNSSFPGHSPLESKISSEMDRGIVVSFADSAKHPNSGESAIEFAE